MSDNVVLSQIAQNRSLSRKFHKLESDLRRQVLRLIDGQTDEKTVLKAIRKVKRTDASAVETAATQS